MSDIKAIATDAAKAARDAAIAKLIEFGVDLIPAAVDTLESMVRAFLRAEVRAHAGRLVVDDQRQPPHDVEDIGGTP